MFYKVLQFYSNGHKKRTVYLRLIKNQRCIILNKLNSKQKNNSNSNHFLLCLKF